MIRVDIVKRRLYLRLVGGSCRKLQCQCLGNLVVPLIGSSEVGNELVDHILIGSDLHHDAVVASHVLRCQLLLQEQSVGLLSCHRRLLSIAEIETNGGLRDQVLREG